jgi:hypothetical protein
MKTQTNLFQEISKTAMNTLTSQVKETVAIGYTIDKSFSAAELWNIQRQRKALRSRRYFG